MVVDSLFLCVCEDRNMNGADGRWKNSRLAELGGHKQQKLDDVDGTELQDVPDKYWRQTVELVGLCMSVQCLIMDSGC